MLNMREPRYPESDKRTLLEAVSLSLFKEGKEIFEEAEIMANFRKVMRESLFYERVGKEAQKLLDEIVKKSGLLYRTAAGRYTFLHLTFQEYFAASALARTEKGDFAQWKKGEYVAVSALKDCVFDPRWEEVMRLLAARLDNATVMVKKILDGEDDIFKRRLCLAAKCAGEAESINGNLLKCITKSLMQAIPIEIPIQFEDIENAASIILNSPKAKGFIKLLCKFLTNENPDARRDAARILGTCKTIEAETALIKAFHDGDYDVSRAVVESLGKIGTTASVEPLTALLCEEFTIDVASSLENIAFSLENIDGKDVIEALINAALTNEYLDIKLDSISALGRMRIKEAVVPLVAAALNDEEDWVRIEVAWSLEQIDSSVAFQLLTKALEDKNLYVRRRAVYTLLFMHTPKSLKPLFLALNDNDNLIKEMALEALGRIGSHAAIEPMLKKLTDEDFSFRKYAVNSIRQIHSTRPIETDNVVITKQLINILKKDVAPVVRNSAAKALGEIGNVTAVDALRSALKDDFSQVRVAAATALHIMGNTDGMDAIVLALQDADIWGRVAAAEALGEIGSEIAVGALQTALQDKDGWVCQTAAKALGKIGNENALEALKSALQDEDSSVRDSAVEALGKIGNENALEALKSALQDEDSSVRDSAVEALGKIGNKNAVEALKLALQDEDSSVRDSAVEALGKIGNKNAVEALKLALQDKEKLIRKNAADLLGEVGEESAVVALLGTINDNDRDCRYAAARAIWKIAKLNRLVVYSDGRVERLPKK